MTPASAETLGLKALTWLASRSEDLGRFLAASGLGPQELRNGASEPGILGGVLDYVLANESLAEAFSTEENILPRDIQAARHILSGEG